MISKAQLRLTPFFFSLFTLCYVAVVNQDTPFRGEHWALLYGFQRATDWTTALGNVGDFVCFGVKRFQPLAFFPAIGSYLLFGLNFLAHNLFSIFLHVIYTAVFLHGLDYLRRGTTKFSPSHFWKYPLEAAFFLVFFPMSDVLTWTFFHYVQIAAILGTSSLIIVLANPESNRGRYLAYAGVAIATLIYEPFVSLAGGFLVWELYRAYHRRTRPGLPFALLAIFTGGVAVVYANQFASYLQFVTDYNDTQRAMVETPLAFKIFSCAHKFAVLALTILYNAIWPTLGVKKQIYELHTFPWLERGAYDYLTFTYLDDRTVLLSAVGGLAFACAIIWLGVKRQRLGQKHPHAPLVFATVAFLLFGVIAWGRPVVRDYAISFQFRYATITLALLVAVGLEFWRTFVRRESIYALTLLILIAVNNFSSFRQGELLADDMRDLSRYVTALKRAGLSRPEIIDRTVAGFTEVKIPVSRKDNYLFTYNAQQCVVEWRSRLTGP